MSGINRAPVHIAEIQGTMCLNLECLHLASGGLSSLIVHRDVWTCVECGHVWTLHAAGRSDFGHVWTCEHVRTCVDMCGQYVRVQGVIGLQ